MNWHDIFFILTGFLSEILGTLSGFGSSTFFVPLAQLLESFQLVLVLTAFLHTVGNISRIYYFRNHLHRDLFLKFAIPSIILSGLGALLTSYVATEILIRLLGVFLVLVATLSLFKRKTNSSLQSLRWGVPLLGVSGFLTGLLGTGGALRGVALASLQLEKNLFIGLSSSIDLGGDLLRLVIYISQGYMDWSQWHYIPGLLVAAWGGAKIGHKLVRHIPQDLFLKLVGLLVLISGFGLLFS